MGFLRRLLGGATANSQPPADLWLLEPRRAGATVNVVGEQSYQKHLAALAGRSANRDFVAALAREPTNRYDKNAIMVVVEGRTVGYLAREDAIRYGPVMEWFSSRSRTPGCQARLTGGRDRDSFIGVVLHIGSPGETLLELIGDDLAVRTDHPWPGQMIAFTGDSQFAIAGVKLDRAMSVVLAQRAGLHVHPRMTKKVQLLVDCDPATESGNELKAIECGAVVIPEGEFWAALGIAVEPVEQWGQRPGWQGR